MSHEGQQFENVFVSTLTTPLNTALFESCLKCQNLGLADVSPTLTSLLNPTLLAGNQVDQQFYKRSPPLLKIALPVKSPRPLQIYTMDHVLNLQHRLCSLLLSNHEIICFQHHHLINKVMVILGLTICFQCIDACIKMTSFKMVVHEANFHFKANFWVQWPQRPNSLPASVCLSCLALFASPSLPEPLPFLHTHHRTTSALFAQENFERLLL